MIDKFKQLLEDLLKADTPSKRSNILAEILQLTTQQDFATNSSLIVEQCLTKLVENNVSDQGIGYLLSLLNTLAPRLTDLVTETRQALNKSCLTLLKKSNETILSETFTLLKTLMTQTKDNLVVQIDFLGVCKNLLSAASNEVYNRIFSVLSQFVCHVALPKQPKETNEKTNEEAFIKLHCLLVELCQLGAKQNIAIVAEIATDLVGIVAINKMGGDKTSLATRWLEFFSVAQGKKQLAKLWTKIIIFIAPLVNENTKNAFLEKWVCAVKEEELLELFKNLLSSLEHVMTKDDIKKNDTIQVCIRNDWIKRILNNSLEKPKYTTNYKAYLSDWTAYLSDSNLNSVNEYLLQNVPKAGIPTLVADWLACWEQDIQSKISNYFYEKFNACGEQENQYFLAIFKQLLLVLKKEPLDGFLESAFNQLFNDQKNESAKQKTLKSLIVHHLAQLGVFKSKKLPPKVESFYQLLLPNDTYDLCLRHELDEVTELDVSTAYANKQIILQKREKNDTTDKYVFLPDSQKIMYGIGRFSGQYTLTFPAVKETCLIVKNDDKYPHLINPIAAGCVNSQEQKDVLKEILTSLTKKCRDILLTNYFKKWPVFFEYTVLDVLLEKISQFDITKKNESDREKKFAEHEGDLNEIINFYKDDNSLRAQLAVAACRILLDSSADIDKKMEKLLKLLNQNSKISKNFLAILPLGQLLDPLFSALLNENELLDDNKRQLITKIIYSSTSEINPIRWEALWTYVQFTFANLIDPKKYEKEKDYQKSLTEFRNMLLVMQISFYAPNDIKEQAAKLESAIKEMPKDSKDEVLIIENPPLIIEEVLKKIFSAKNQQLQMAEVKLRKKEETFSINANEIQQETETLTTLKENVAKEKKEAEMLKATLLTLQTELAEKEIQQEAKAKERESGLKKMEQALEVQTATLQEKIIEISKAEQALSDEKANLLQAKKFIFEQTFVGATQHRQLIEKILMPWDDHRKKLSETYSGNNASTILSIEELQKLSPQGKKIHYLYKIDCEIKLIFEKNIAPSDAAKEMLVAVNKFLNDQHIKQVLSGNHLETNVPSSFATSFHLLFAKKELFISSATILEKMVEDLNDLLKKAEVTEKSSKEEIKRDFAC